MSIIWEAEVPARGIFEFGAHFHAGSWCNKVASQPACSGEMFQSADLLVRCVMLIIILGQIGLNSLMIAFVESG